MKRPVIIVLALLLLGGGAFAWWRVFKFGRISPSATPETSAALWLAKSPTPSAAKPRPGFAKFTDASIPWQQRVDHCNELLVANTLTAADVDALFSLLRDHRSSAGRDQNETWFVVANEIMELMRERGIGADRYTTELSALLADPAQHFVVRDYAIQHLSMWLYPATPGAPGETDPAARVTGLTAIAKAATDPAASHTSIPGTALMALADITERQPDGALATTWARLEPEIKAWFSPDSSATLPNRVSALQAVSRAGVQGLHPMVRRLAEDAGADPSIRLSAVAALGFYGHAEDQPLLIQIAQANPQLRHAAQSALKRISGK